MTVDRVSPTKRFTRPRRPMDASMRITKATARTCCFLPFIMAALALNTSARSDKFTIKYINIRQLLEDDTLNNHGNQALGEKYSIKCNGTTCIGIIPITLGQKIYRYEAVMYVLTGDSEFIGIRMNLHPTETACGPRCAEPSLHSTSTSIPWTTKAHVTVPIKQFGDFPPTMSPGSTSDLVYRTHPDPVAYLDLSIEFE
jgi:hypothetical protein